jgi:GTP-binding protein
LNELNEYNPELLQKDFLIAISKSDMLDDELKEAIAKELPKDIPHLFFSSITQTGLLELKDALWKILTKPVGN